MRPQADEQSSSSASREGAAVEDGHVCLAAEDEAGVEDGLGHYGETEEARRQN